MTTPAQTVVIIIPPHAQTLDVTGPLSTFREAYRQSNGLIGYNVKLMSLVHSKSIEMDGMTVNADYSIQDPDFNIDTLLIAGTHKYQQAFDMPEYQQWLQRRIPDIRRYGSVCTGAFFLGEAGLLDEKRVTTHWQQADELTSRYPKANVQADSIYIQDGKLCTSAGITAGIDLTLKLIEDDHGKELALKIARRLVMFLRRPGGQSQFSAHLAAQIAQDGRIQAVQHWLLANINSDLSVPVLANRAAMSARNFSRLFRKETGDTPAEFVEFARIDAAKRLLEETDMPLQRIASHCGFTNVDLMRRAFIRHLSISAGDYRIRFKGVNVKTN